jgi:hypothetical protein
LRTSLEVPFLGWHSSQISGTNYVDYHITMRGQCCCCNFLQRNRSFHLVQLFDVMGLFLSSEGAKKKQHGLGFMKQSFLGKLPQAICFLLKLVSPFLIRQTFVRLRLCLPHTQLGLDELANVCLLLALCGEGLSLAVVSNFISGMKCDLSTS